MRRIARVSHVEKEQINTTKGAAMAKHEVTRRGFIGTLGAGLAASRATVLRARAQAADTAPAPADKNIVYGKGGDTELHLDIYRAPAAKAKKMAILHLHGGGFTGGSKDGLAARIAPLTARGYVNIASQYRLGAAGKWPAQIEDVKAAIRWTRLHAADLGIDPRRIGLAGHSAGGYLALFTAATQNRPEFEGHSGSDGAGTELAACLGFYAVTNPAVQSANFPWPPDRTDETTRLAMPATYIKGFPPTILFHGLADVTVPPESSLQFLQQLREAGIPSELHTFDGVPHEFDQHPEFAELSLTSQGGGEIPNPPLAFEIEGTRRVGVRVGPVSTRFLDLACRP